MSCGTVRPPSDPARAAAGDGALRPAVQRSGRQGPATFEIITVTGWAPHESQQKPLKPGSAKMRLADALGTVEIKTGDKAG
jgi:hypothetical protein